MTTTPCPHCGEAHPPFAKFCPKTGGVILSIPSEQFAESSDEIVCPHCGNIHAANARFCPTTGQTLVPTIIAESLSASPSDSTIIAPPSRQPLSRWLPFVGGGAIGLIVIAIGLMCLMGFATPIAIARIFISATPTPTITPSPTSTPTPTSTVTPSRTPTPTLTLTPSRTPIPLPGSTQTSSQDGMVSAYVAEGNFTMGSNIPSVTYGRRDAMPARSVYLDGFWIDQTEVTNGMFALCVKVNMCQPPNPTRSATRSSYYGSSQFNDYPVIYVTWDDARKYCEWANRRLPTEAEWEKAARGTDGRSYPWGNSYPYTNLLNFNLSIRDTTKVGQYPNGKSPYGVFDMAGNVWEWVADFYDENYYGNAPTQNPKGPTSGSRRSFRGGGFGNTDIDEVRATYRGGTGPTARTPEIGFRCAK